MKKTNSLTNESILYRRTVNAALPVEKHERIRRSLSFCAFKISLPLTIVGIRRPRKPFRSFKRAAHARNAATQDRADYSLCTRRDFIKKKLPQQAVPSLLVFSSLLYD